MSRFLQIRDQYSRIFGRRFLNSQLSLYIGLLQLVVCVWALFQHVYSIVNFNKILFCDFNANSTLPTAFAGVDAIIFDIGLFHSLWGIDGCVAEHLDGGYGRFGWCVTHSMVLVICLPCAFLNRPRPFLLWPLLIQQSIYGIGLLILSLAALPRILPTFMGDLNNAPMTAIFAYVLGMCMNFFLLYVYWHWYWHVEAEWDSARKLRDGEVSPSMNSRRPTLQSQRKQPILTQPGGDAPSHMENGLKRGEKVVKVDDEGHAPDLRTSNGHVAKGNGHIPNGLMNGKVGNKVSLRRADDKSAMIIREDEPPLQVRELVHDLAREFVLDRQEDRETPVTIERRFPGYFKSGADSPQGSTASSVYSASALRRPKYSDTSRLAQTQAISVYRRQQTLPIGSSPSQDSSISLSVNSHSNLPKYDYESNSTTATPLSTATTSRVRQDRRKTDHTERRAAEDRINGYSREPIIVAPHSTPILRPAHSQTPIKMHSTSPKSDVLPRTLAQSRMRMLRKYQSTEQDPSPIQQLQRPYSQSLHNSFVEENTYDRVHTPSETTLNSGMGRETPTADGARRKDTMENGRVPPSSDLYRPAIFPGQPLSPMTNSPSSYAPDPYLHEPSTSQWPSTHRAVPPTVLKVNPALAYVQANGQIRQSSLDNNLLRGHGRTGYGSDPEAPRRTHQLHSSRTTYNVYPRPLEATYDIEYDTTTCRPNRVPAPAPTAPYVYEKQVLAPTNSLDSRFLTHYTYQTGL